MATRRTSDSSRNPKSSPAPTPTRSAKPAASETKLPKAAPTVPDPAATPMEAAPARPAPVKRVRKPKASATSSVTPEVSEEVRRAMIAESAYLRAERRGFAPGHEVEDWCAAEKEIEALLSARPGAAAQ
jgi:Protein of unknown function (DUF2934)